MGEQLKGKAKADFLKWYKDYSTKYKLNPDPYEPKHYYDYEGAWKAGERPDASGHMSSKYKKYGHPRLVIEQENPATGRKERYNTRTGKYLREPTDQEYESFLRAIEVD